MDANPADVLHDPHVKFGEKNVSITIQPGDANDKSSSAIRQPLLPKGTMTSDIVLSTPIQVRLDRRVKQKTAEILDKADTFAEFLEARLKETFSNNSPNDGDDKTKTKKKGDEKDELVLYVRVVWMKNQSYAKTAMDPLALYDGRSKVGVNWVLASTTTTTTSNDIKDHTKGGGGVIYMGRSYVVATQEDDFEAYCQCCLGVDLQPSQAPYMAKKIVNAVEEHLITNKSDHDK